jgi:hypothetical protein
MRDRVLDYVSVLWPSRALRSGAVDDWLAPLGGTVGDADGTVLTARWARTAAERTYEADNLRIGLTQAYSRSSLDSEWLASRVEVDSE